MMGSIPDWFWEAVDQKPQDHYVPHGDIDLHYLSWNEAGQRDLLFIHGHNAHAHWWDFIAPAFCDAFHPIAMDLSGMGDSDHRDAYSAEDYADEVVAIADAAGLANDALVVAHSFGGIMALRACAKYPDRFGGLVLIDSGAKHPDDQKPREPERWSKPKIYPDLEVARSRFRLQPPQPCENEYLVQHIARHSLESMDDGWVWKFDEELNSRMNWDMDPAADVASIQMPMALIYGANSESFSSKSAEHMASLASGLEVIELADAQHHLFLDQPEAFTKELRSILARWSA
jgi:pimeloyl-ACP methyl ester carboxylesterase